MDFQSVLNIEDRRMLFFVIFYIVAGFANLLIIGIMGIDFNIQERKMLYTELALIYHYQCFDFKAELRTFYFRDRPETQFRISFGLWNIGKTTDFLGGAEF